MRDDLRGDLTDGPERVGRGDASGPGSRPADGAACGVSAVPASIPIAQWRVYTEREVEAARRVLTRRYKVDATEYEAIWFLRDQHEPGWRYRKDIPADRLVNCLTPAILAQRIEARRAETRRGSVEDESRVGEADASATTYISPAEGLQPSPQAEVAATSGEVVDQENVLRAQHASNFGMEPEACRWPKRLTE